jgi:hypothetical protein
MENNVFKDYDPDRLIKKMKYQALRRIYRRVSFGILQTMKLYMALDNWQFLHWKM